MTTLGLLHTSPVHVATFDALADGQATDVDLVHLVCEDLLARARAEGPESVSGELAAALDRLDADVVLCTCSTIGGVAERLDSRVLRVDRPMAELAVATAPAGPIAVLAAVASTLTPTRDLLAEAAARAGVDPQVEMSVVPDAWSRFESGDLAGYHDVIARAVERAGAAGAAVVVLAQASMAPAGGLARVDVPVLSSPAPGLAEALRRATTPPAARWGSGPGGRTR